MPHLTLRTGLAALTALAWVTAIGCSGDSTSPTNTPVSAAEVQQIGADVSGQLESLSSEFTFRGLLTPDFPFAASATGAFGQGLPPSIKFRPSMPNCPTITPFPPVDTDGDHIPDDVTLSFTLPACSFSRGSINLEITGTVEISDPSPTGFGQRIEFTDFQHKITGPNGNFFLSRLNGVRQHLITDILSLTDSTTAEFQSNDRPSATQVNRWQVTFTPDPGEVFDNDHHLPSGNFDVSGSTTHTFEQRSRTLTVMTVSPVHLDATCTLRPRFTSGELEITFMNGDRTVTIHIVFNGCGVAPTVTHEETPVA